MNIELRMSERVDIAGELNQCAAELTYASERLIQDVSAADILLDIGDIPEAARRAVERIEELVEEEDAEDEEEDDSQ